MQEFYTTGQYPQTSLMAKPWDFVSALKSDPQVKGTQIPLDPVIKGNVRYTGTQNMTDSEAKQWIGRTMLSDERAMMWAIQQFEDPSNAKDAEKYLMQYDVNGNHIIDPAEKKTALSEPMNLNNPILKWAQDKFAPELIKKDYGRGTNIPSKTGGASSTRPNPGVRRQTSVIYGDQQYNNPYDFDGRFKLTNVPTIGGKKLKGTVSLPITSKGNIEGYLKEYVPEKEVLIS